MPDILLCEGTKCPRAKACYRFTATPSKYAQSYFTEPPFTNIKRKFNCDYYWPNELGKKDKHYKE